MYDLQKEYDQFGPWLVEIKSAQDIPPQFEDQSGLLDDALFAFKTPVHQERRNLKPGMLLYSQIVIIQNEFIIHLSIKGEKIHANKMWFKDVLLLTHGGDLLDNYIGLQSNQGEMIIRYNLVSQDIASRAIQVLRHHIATREKAPFTAETANDALKDSDLYSYFSGTEHCIDPIVILAGQKEMKLTEKKRSGLLDLQYSFTEYHLLDSMVMCDGVDLIIANRGKSIIDVKDANYKFGHTFIRLNAIQDVRIEPNLNFPELNNVVFKIDLCEFTLAVDKHFTLTPISTVLDSIQQVEDA
jgi:hypothetical protein